jgi:tetratricopeptide (TPR) repeat protein
MKKAIAIVISIISLVGCSEDFLVQPPLNTPTTGNYWNTEEEAILAVNSLYQTFRMGEAFNTGFIEFGDMMADDMTAGTYGGFIVPLDQLNIDPSQARLTGGNDHFGFWGVWYNTVYRANWILANVRDTKNISKEILQRSINEAHFFRGVAYFMLVNYFGGVPLFTNIISPEEAKKIPRANAEEVWQQIESDLLKSAGLDVDLNPSGNPLPPKGAYELGRATEGAALGFLARMYLYREEFQKAEEIAKKIIDLGRYGLNPDFGANWDNMQENGIESIFEIQYKAGETGYVYGMWPGNQINGNTANAAFAPGGRGWNNYVASHHMDTLFETNSEGQEDKRRIMTIFRVGDQYPFNPEQEYYLTNDKDPNGYTISKYVLRNDIISVQQDINNLLDADNNIPIVRYAEILLIYAEALYRNGKSAEAFDQLNKIRARAGLDPLDGTENFMEKLIHERRIELAFEGHRYLDLKRWGLLDEVLGPYGYRKETKGLLPIPLTEIDLNSSLMQNDGY